MERTTDRINYPLIICLACLSIISMNPFFIWGENRSYYVIFLILSLVSFILSRQKSMIFLTCCLIFILVFSYHYLNGASFLGCFAFSASVVLIYNLKIKQLEKTFYVFSFLYVILLIPGLFLWIIHGLTGRNDLLKLGSIPTSLIPSQFKVLVNEGYSLYPGAVILDYMENDRIYRFLGAFDEPGVVGTVSALMLISIRFNLKTWISNIIFFSGLVSFSLAFYLLSILYLLTIIFFRFQRYKSKIIPLVIIVLFSIAGELANVKTLSRIGVSFVSNAVTEIRLHGDNRGNPVLEAKYAEWKSSKGRNLLFGFRGIDFRGASSWKQIPIATGVVGVVLLVSIVLIFALRYVNVLTLEFLMFFSMFILSIYQRPGVLTIEYILILTYGALVTTRQTEDCVASQQSSST